MRFLFSTSPTISIPVSVLGGVLGSCAVELWIRNPARSYLYYSKAPRRRWVWLGLGWIVGSWISQKIYR